MMALAFDFFPFNRPGIEVWRAGGYDCPPILISEGERPREIKGMPYFL
jgi:hypothetical protein